MPEGSGQPMTDRVVLVTGGSRGVGRGIAEELAGQGARVFVTGRTVDDAELASGCAPVVCDHTDDEQVRRAFDRVLSEGSRIDVLTDRLTADTAAELRPHGVAVVSVYPGLVRTEKVMLAAAFLDLTNSESSRFMGRVVSALARDPAIMEKSGTVLIAAACAREYGFTDIDGRQPTPLRLEDM
jgi:NAD(P)-dependent dehydrogenase (short-subunit alcohol dehydrogenase family)